jgi:RNA polymerase sigma factor (sigma-70 family)
MTNDNNTQLFQGLIMPHLGMAYNYARWIVKDEAAAQDIVQESCLRAFKGVHRITSDRARGWLLTIVRHESYDWLSKSAGHNHHADIDDEEALSPEDRLMLSHHDTPEHFVMKLQDKALLEKALLELPAGFREVLILKEQEEMSYQEIAKVIGAPIGTVMSRLARGRAQLKKLLTGAHNAKR